MNHLDLEALELRLLMSGKPLALAKLGDSLNNLAGSYANLHRHHHAITDAALSAVDPLLHIRKGQVAIRAVATSGQAKSLAKSLAKLGARNVIQNDKLVSATVPVKNLVKLQKIKALSFATPVLAQTNVGTVTSQGGTATEADIARATYGLDGTGVTVGILSDSFDTSTNTTDHYAQDVASGDLPAGVTVLEDSPDGTDEGRAMAQLVHDAAPGAKIMFATGFNSDLDFSDQIRALAKAGCNIIVDDITYFNEPFFQDGIIAQAVDDVVSEGVSYFSSAGNEDTKSYQSAFNPGPVLADGAFTGTNSSMHFWGGTAHDFDPGDGVDTMQSFTLAPGASTVISLQWDQPFASAGSLGSQSDIDLYVLDSSNQLVATSTDDNINADPVEIVDLSNSSSTTQTYSLMIVNFAGPDPGTIKYINFGNANFTDWNTNSSTLIGHANAAGAESVAAAAWYNTPAFGVDPAQVESYSSVGGTPIMFDKLGNRLATPITRNKPGIMAADGGNTTFFGFDVSQDSDSFPNFFGTSAAAPEAAAVAALMLQRSPGLAPATVYSALESTSQDAGSPGYDYKTGFGLIDADAAIAAISTGSISGTAFQDNNGNGIPDGNDVIFSNKTVYLDSNNNGQFDSVTSTQSASPNEPIPDLSTVTNSFNFSGLDGVVDNVTLGFSINHTYDADLRIFLIDPQGKSVELVRNRGNSGQNFVNTVFSDSATTPIADGSAPFTGTFQPEVALSSLDGDNPNGTWTLQISDVGPGDTGTLINWSMTLISGEPATTSDASGHYTFGNLAPGSYHPAVNVTGTYTSTTGDTTRSISGFTTFSNDNIGLFPIVFNGSSGDDTYDIKNNAGQIEIDEILPTGTNIYTAPAALIPSLTFNTGSGNDRVKVETNAVPITFNGALSGKYIDTLEVATPNFSVNSNVASNTQNMAVQVDGGASVTFNSSQTLAALDVLSGGKATLASNGGFAIKTNELTANGLLDLTNNGLILEYSGTSPINSIRQSIGSAFDNGIWDATTGITSSAAQADSNNSTALGYAEATDLAIATYHGMSIVGNAIVIDYTYYGDTNLDHKVNQADYSDVLAGFNHLGSDWFHGDINYDSATNLDDFSIFIDQFNAHQNG